MYRVMLTGKNLLELVEEAKKFIGEIDDLQYGGNYDTPIPPDIEDSFLPEEVTESPVEIPAANLSTEVDSRGIRFDDRIHSASKSINKDGSWRSRRGVEPELIKKLEAEQGAPAIAAQPVVPSAPIQTVAPITTPVPAAPPVALPLAPPPLPAQQPVTLAHSVDSFKSDLVRVLTELVKQGKLTQDYINALKNYFKVQEIWQVTEEQTVQMFEQFVSAGLLTRVG